MASKDPDLKIIVDTREKTPLPLDCITETGTLKDGDYGLPAPLNWDFIVERKSVADLRSCLNSSASRTRFEYQLMRLRGYKFHRLIIVGTEQEFCRGSFFYRSKMSPKALLHSCYALEARTGVPFVWVDTEEEAARLVKRWAHFTLREFNKNIK